MKNCSVNVTLQLEGWSSKRVVALMEWIEATRGLGDDATQETSERLTAYQKAISAEVKEDLVEVKTELDQINKEADPVTPSDSDSDSDSDAAPSPAPEQATFEEVFEDLIRHVVSLYRDSFTKYFRQAVAKTQAELNDITGNHVAGNELTDALKRVKGGANMSQIDEEKMGDLVRLLLTTRHNAGLSVLLEDDMESLTSQLGLDQILLDSLMQAKIRLSEAA